MKLSIVQCGNESAADGLSDRQGGLADDKQIKLNASERLSDFGSHAARFPILSSDPRTRPSYGLILWVALTHQKNTAGFFLRTIHSWRSNFDNRVPSIARRSAISCGTLQRCRPIPTNALNRHFSVRTYRGTCGAADTASAGNNQANATARS